MIAWLGFPRPFGSRWDREFESALFQQRVSCELGADLEAMRAAGREATVGSSGPAALGGLEMLR
jgi:hypothetical protein